MKKATSVKYPHSANLFQFCRRILDHKFGGIRVIDQDVGQILGFDPADCSHWKKGKKNIRSIQAIKSIADHLGVDERLVVDVAIGDIDDQEAFQEFSGYGIFDIDARVVDTAKKDFYRRNAAGWSKDKEGEFKAFFDANEPAITAKVREIHQALNFVEAPLYLPELVSVFNKVQLVGKEAEEIGTASGVSSGEQDERFVINYVNGRDARPYMRFRIAHALADYFLKPLRPRQLNELGDYAKHVTDVQNNLFAARLLAPANLIRKEMSNINVSKDVVAQLAEIFWVSKAFMNRRLKEILERAPEL